MKIYTCPSCNVKSLERIKGNIKRRVGRRNIIIPDVEYEKCNSCGEELYGSEALDKIDKYLGLDKDHRTAG